MNDIDTTYSVIAPRAKPSAAWQFRATPGTFDFGRVLREAQRAGGQLIEISSERGDDSYVAYTEDYHARLRRANVYSPGAPPDDAILGMTEQGRLCVTSFGKDAPRWYGYWVRGGNRPSAAELHAGLLDAEVSLHSIAVRVYA